MIHKITANQSSFRPVDFKPGLNVVLADRTYISTQRDTRNGLGKSTLIDIIDFCFGSRVRRGYGLAIEPLHDWEFTLECTLAGSRVKATRAVANPSRVIVDGEIPSWSEQADSADFFGERVFNIEQWRSVLQWTLFGLGSAHDVTDYHPSFRGLVSYFVRRGGGAYLDPFSHSRHQSTWHKQLHVAFLLGMNWENASKWQEMKDQMKGLKAFNHAIQTGVVTGARGTVGELEAESIQLESQLKRESRALEEFKVHPQYESIQNEANQLTVNIHTLTNDNVVDQRRLTRYKEAVSTEVPPPDATIDELYGEVGVVFPELIRRTLSDAREYHSKIVENRRVFLSVEIKRLESKIESRMADIRKQTEKRAELLKILDTHGALQEMAQLQERVVELRSKYEKVRTWITEQKDIASKRRNLQIQKTELAKTAEQDHEERRELWSVAVGFFGDNSRFLYETPGRLVIDISESGFKYDVEINKSGSEGVGKMKIFCFDLMLLQLMARRSGKRVDFLIHDSGIYDGVDSRQRALALELASATSEEIGTQYICTMNSDMVPRDDFSSTFRFDDHVRLTLGDKYPEESLLGFRFEQP